MKTVSINHLNITTALFVLDKVSLNAFPQRPRGMLQEYAVVISVLRSDVTAIDVVRLEDSVAVLITDFM